MWGKVQCMKVISFDKCKIILKVKSLESLNSLIFTVTQIQLGKATSARNSFLTPKNHPLKDKPSNKPLLEMTAEELGQLFSVALLATRLN